jgi:uncharacterized RDD family membrane protein YckC
VYLPPGVQVAGMGRRVGAWILDGFVGGLVSGIAVILAIVTGAVSLNSQALDQIKQIDQEAYRPFATVTAPLLNVNTGLLIVAAAVYVALSAVYYAGCWAKYGGTPCQQGLHLRVADVASGNKLSLGQALLRWLLLEGLSVGVGAVFLVLMCDAISTTPTNEWLGSNAYGTLGLTSFGSLTLVSDLVSWGSLIWLIVLIVSAGTNPLRRGLHDRLAGSIVVGPAQAVAGWPGYPYPPQGAPGYSYPPQAWPGYPPQGPAYPPQAWPGYPPQGPVYPPQAWPGYPPQGGPGYPPPPAPPPQAWPAYPPQGAAYPPQAWPGYPPPPTQPAPPTSPAPGDRPTGDENQAPGGQ